MRQPDLKKKDRECERRKKRKVEEEGGKGSVLAVRDICTTMRARGPADLLVDSVT